MNRKHLTSELIDEIKKIYDSSSETIDYLEKKYNVPRYTIINTANKLGLNKKKSKKWTDEELEFIYEKWHKGPKYVSKKLNRTETGVKLKAKRLGLGGCVTGSHKFTATFVAKIIDIDHHVITKWMKQGLLKYSKAPVNRITYLIDLKDLINFLKNNQELWDSRKLQKELLWIETPEWLKEKMKRDQFLAKKSFQKWTKEEDTLAIALFKTGDYTYREIGEKLGRSHYAVKRRLRRLDVWGTGEYIGDKYS